MEDKVEKEVSVHLWIGGMETMDRESAVHMYFEGEADKSSFPRNPKIMYAMNIPLIWFWMEIESSDERPELPSALSQEHFSIHHVYPYSEFYALYERFVKEA